MPGYLLVGHGARRTLPLLHVSLCASAQDDTLGALTAFGGVDAEHEATFRLTQPAAAAVTAVNAYVLEFDLSLERPVLNGQARE